MEEGREGGREGRSKGRLGESARLRGRYGGREGERALEEGKDGRTTYFNRRLRLFRIKSLDCSVCSAALYRPRPGGPRQKHIVGGWAGGRVEGEKGSLSGGVAVTRGRGSPLARGSRQSTRRCIADQKVAPQQSR